jgi:hypothetical protein
MITSLRIESRWAWMVLTGISLLSATTLPVWAEDAVELPAAAQARPEPPGVAAPTESPKYRSTLRREINRPVPPTPAVPSDADQLLQRYREQQAAALRDVIASLRSLQEKYLANNQRRQASAVEAKIAELQQQLAACTDVGVTSTVGVQADPGNLVAFRDRVSQTFLFQVTGSNNETQVIWGGEDGVYTDDSPLALAAVHAGVLRAGETGVVEVDVLPGRSSYGGCTKNGITSRSYAEFGGSYRISRQKLPVNFVQTIDLTQYRGRNGQTMTFVINGDANAGTVWGGDFGVYTDDSALAAAAVHAGVLKNGQRGTVRVTILPGRDSYPAISRNGVESSKWESWGGSYKIEGAGEVVPPPAIPQPAVPMPGTVPPKFGSRTDYPVDNTDPTTTPNLSNFRGQNNAIIYVQVTGTTEGSVWGSDVYTDDSTLGAAAVHAGLLKPGEKALLKVKILPGRAEYSGCERNGVTSRPYAEWGGSFSLEKANLAAPGLGGDIDINRLHWQPNREGGQVHSYTRGLEEK